MDGSGAASDAGPGSDPRESYAAVAGRNSSATSQKWAVFPNAAPRQLLTTPGRDGLVFTEFMKATNDNALKAIMHTQQAVQTAITIFVAEFLASQNAEEKTLQVVSVAGPRHATHLNYQVLGDRDLFHRLLLWGTQDRGRKLEVTILIPGKAPLNVSQCLSCVAESEGGRYCTPMAVRYPDAKRRFIFEFTGELPDASLFHVAKKEVEEEFRAYHVEVKVGRGMYGGQVVLVEADETLQGDRRFNATIDESKAIAGRATVELGRLVVSDANGTIKHWPMINSRRLEHSRRQARETIAGERHANSGVGVAPVITRAAPDQEEAAQATTSQTAAARQAAALATAERAAADQEEAAARRAAADQEEAAQAAAVLAAAGRAADQEEGPFTMVPTKQKRERATSTTPGNSPPRTRKSSTTAQQRMGKFWGENSDEGTDEETLMSVSDDEENGDIVGKIATTATGAGKRATWVAKPLQALRNAEKQKCRATNHERLDAIVEKYARELGQAEEIRDFFRHNGTPTDKVAIYQPLYLTAVKRFRHSRQFKDQMQLINCPMQISILDFGPLFGGDDPAAAIALTFRSIAAAVAAHELLMELHHKNEWPPFALEFVGQDL